MQYIVELNHKRVLISSAEKTQWLAGSIISFFVVHPQRTQQKRFQEIIRMLTPTLFSKNINLINMYPWMIFEKEFPFEHTKDLHPWLSSYHEQQSNAITTARVTSFVETSGTTARPKWIPSHFWMGKENKASANLCGCYR